jgi:D-amino-acid dehydrogenase
VARCVVVGGGIVGASAAYHLAAAGEDVVLVDREDPGHATAAGAGIVAPGLSLTLTPAWQPLAFAALASYERLLDELREQGQAGIEYEVVGAVHVARTEEEREQLPDTLRLFEERRSAGVVNIGELSLLDGDGLRALCPVVNDAYGGIHAAGAARVDGRSLREALVRAFESLGGERRHGSASLVTSGARVTGVELGGDRLGTDVVVLATGAWSDALVAVAGRDFGVAPQRGQILHLEVADADTGRWPILYGYDHHYALTFPPHRLVVGATREPGTGFDRRITLAGQRDLVGQALAFAPGLTGATVLETRVGFRPVTADGVPLIGPVPGCEGAFVATGLGPLGLTIGPHAGALIADMALGRPTATDLTPFAPDRLD